MNSGRKRGSGYKMSADDTELESGKERNFEERLRFIKFWADYVKAHPDEYWSEKRVLIDSQMKRERE